MIPVEPTEMMKAFDRHLAECGLEFSGVVVGGTALVLLGIVARATNDCDVLYPKIPEEIAAAARAFAARMTADRVVLREDWLNNGPSSLARDLPDGWELRLQPLYGGQALTLRTLGRRDLLCTKLFALCDRQMDLLDCLAMAPLAGELEAVLPWLVAQDAHPGWPDHVRATVADLGRRLGHAP
jgi:hypothetical protein